METKDIRKWGAEAILTGMVLPIILAFIFWFLSFVLSSYQTIAEVNNLKEDVAEIKNTVKETNSDVKDILKSLGNK